MAGAIPNTLRPTRDDSNFPLEIRRIVKVESLAFWDLLVRALQKIRGQFILFAACLGNQTNMEIS